MYLKAESGETYSERFPKLDGNLRRTTRPRDSLSMNLRSMVG
jgi:hypothetical protein